MYKKKHIIQVELNSRIWKVESRSSLWNLRWRKWNSWVTLCTRKVLIKIYICTCFLLLKKRIFSIFFNQCFKEFINLSEYVMRHKNLNELEIVFEKKINDLLILFVVTPYSFLKATELFFQYKEICPLGSYICPSSSLMVSWFHYESE